MRIFYVLLTVVCLIFGITGCATTPDMTRQNQEQADTIAQLNQKIQQLTSETDQLNRSSGVLQDDKNALENKISQMSIDLEEMKKLNKRLTDEMNALKARKG